MLSGRVLIVGQGLAGTALGLELEAAGIDFTVASDGHAAAASRIAAGLINPVTGRRWVKSAQVDELLPEAEAFYRRAEMLLGLRLWHPLRLRRLWPEAAERGAVEAKIARDELAPYLTPERVGEAGAELRGAARVDVPALLAAAEARWRANGRLVSARVMPGDFACDADGLTWGGRAFGCAVLCTGAAPDWRGLFPELPGEVAQGEILTLAGTGVSEPDALVQAGHWLLGGAEGEARVGSTYVRGCVDPRPTPAAREVLLAAASAMSGRGDLVVRGQQAGLRLTLPDRRPAAGWSRRQPRVGWCGALGSKGALWAPRLARAWREHAQREIFFPEEFSTARW